MHTSSLLVAALVAAASVAGEEAARPKIYFPRQIKRQFLNATITSQDPSPPPSSTASDTTKRQSLSDFLPSFSDLFPDPAGTSSSTSSEGQVTTVVMRSTVYVSPTDTPSSDSTSAETTPTSTAAGDASTSGLPDVIIPATSRTESSSSTAAAETSTSTADPSESDSSSITSTTSPLAESTTAADPTTTSTETTSSSGILLAPTGVVTPTSSIDPLAPLSSLISGVISDVTSIIAPTQNATESAPVETTTTTPLLVIPTDSVFPSGTGPTSTVDPLSTSSQDPIISISVSAEPTETTTTSSLPSGITLSGSGPSGTGPSGTGPTDVPPPVSTNSTSIDIPTSLPPVSVNSTVVETTPPPTSTPTESSDPLTSSVSVNSTLTDLPPPVTVPPTTTTSLASVITIPANTTSVNNTAVPPESTVSPPPVTSAPSSAPTDGYTSLPAVSTITDSHPWMPTTILVQPSTTTISAPGGAPTSGTGLPTGLPRAITPDTGDVPVPEDSQEIQVALKYPLNYRFLLENSVAATQVVTYLSQALSFAAGVSKERTQVRRIVPLDTDNQLGFLTTLVIADYPKGLVDALRLDIKTPNAKIYQNPVPIVANLTKQINPSIDILLGSGLDGSGTGTGSGSSSTTTSNPGGDVFNNGGDGSDKDQSASSKGITAGIAMGAVVVSAAYGTAMFIIARRYKRKKQAHRRASSITNPSEMRQTAGSPPMMGGALLSRDFSSYGGVAGGRDSHGSGRSGAGNSGRTAYISAPVAAENSLGWN